MPVDNEGMHYIQRPNRHRFLYLIRHGQYVRTEEHPDGTLTELGRRQAALLAERIQDLAVDTIWSSTMYRAQETAQIIVDQHFPHLEVQRSTLLREKLFPTEDERWDNASARHRAPEDRLQRISSRWLRRSNQERHELLVCHGNVIRAIVTRVLGAETGRWLNLGTHHCGLTRIGCWDDGRVSVITYNDISYLPDEYVSVV